MTLKDLYLACEALLEVADENTPVVIRGKDDSDVDIVYLEDLETVHIK